MSRKTDIALSLGMLSEQQQEDIIHFCDRFGFTASGFFRFAGLRLLEDFKKEYAFPELKKELEEREYVADKREQAGFARAKQGQKKVFNGFGANTGTRSA